MAIVAIVTVTGIVLGLDYRTYSSYQQSKFFGSKDVYTQDQSLYFDDIKVTITEVEHKHYDYQTYASCQSLTEEAGALMRENNFIKTLEWEIKASKSERCVEMANLYENKKMLIVHFFVENLNDKPFDLSEYDIKILGDEKAESTETEEELTTLLARQSKYNAFVIHHLPINQDGPFALIASREGQQKQIEIDLPEIQPFCTSPICEKEVYDRIP